jgi:hypothetical protein
MRWQPCGRSHRTYSLERGQQVDVVWDVTDRNQVSVMLNCQSCPLRLLNDCISNTAVSFGITPHTAWYMVSYMVQPQQRNTACLKDMLAFTRLQCCVVFQRQAASTNPTIFGPSYSSCDQPMCSNKPVAHVCDLCHCPDQCSAPHWHMKLATGSNYTGYK